MKKKGQSVFNVSQMKQIMQRDTDVGKVTKPAPIVFSKALELFLQDLCDRAYGITLSRGAKIMTAHHLKECIRTYSMFDFLEGVVSHVPDEPAAAASNKGVRRKAVKRDNDDSGKTESKKRSRSDSSSGRGRGRGRGRGKSNSESMKLGDPGKLNDTEAPSLPRHHDGSPKLQGGGLNEIGEVATTGKQDLTAEEVLSMIRESDKIFQAEEDYDCED